MHGVGLNRQSFRIGLTTARNSRPPWRAIRRLPRRKVDFTPRPSHHPREYQPDDLTVRHRERLPTPRRLWDFPETADVLVATGPTSEEIDHASRLHHCHPPADYD
jgi:hypothetical protein